MLTLTLLVLLAAFALTLWSAVGKGPLWVAVLLIVILLLIQILPVR